VCGRGGFATNLRYPRRGYNRTDVLIQRLHRDRPLSLARHQRALLPERDARALHALFADTLGDGAELLLGGEATRSAIASQFAALAPAAV
jgi:hypothetical protein